MLGECFSWSQSKSFLYQSYIILHQMWGSRSSADKDFCLLVDIVVLVLVFCLCPSSVSVVATFPGTVLFPLLCSVLPLHTDSFLYLVLLFQASVSKISSVLLLNVIHGDHCCSFTWGSPPALVKKMVAYRTMELFFSLHNVPTNTEKEGIGVKNLLAKNLS